jgi:ParB family chromosome partitioning protein
MLIAIDTIHESPGNARKVGAGPAADAALQASIDKIGLLQPVLVAPSPEPGQWLLRAGHRRLAAMRALGHTQIEATDRGAPDDDIPEVAISAAENMVRAGMHPVDQWRAVAALQAQAGYDLDTAAAVLGVASSLARRLSWLGQMHPALLDAMAQGDLPDAQHLRAIALAPHDVQREALARGTYSTTTQAERVDWRTVAECCKVRRIPQSRALFDITTLTWDEDLFAQPDADDRYTTTDTTGFLNKQSAALDAQVAKSKGRIERIAYDTEGKTKAPKGWQLTYGEVPKRWKKDDPRRAFAVLIEDGYQIGTVVFQLGEPVATRAEAEDARGATRPQARPPINKAVQARLSFLKAQAVRERLADIAPTHGSAFMLKALLLALTFRNVSARSGIADALIDPQGQPLDLSEAKLCALTASTIADMTVFDRPDGFNSSGAAAEWLATLIGANMPRTDTADILRGISGEALAAIAEAHSVSARGTVGALRKRLVGALPDWRAASFGKAGPIHYTDADEDETEVTEFAEVGEHDDDVTVEAVGEEIAE